MTSLETTKVQEYPEGYLSMWNHEISEAPKGQTITVNRKVKTKDGVIDASIEQFVPDILWLASDCGKVIRSYWIPANKYHNGYFPGFAQSGAHPPIAWQRFFTPEHPGVVGDAS